MCRQAGPTSLQEPADQPYGICDCTFRDHAGNLVRINQPLEPSAWLASSSLLHAWGNAGAHTLIAELVPDEDRVTGNALLSTFNQVSYVVGPGAAGGLIGWAGPGWAIAADAPASRYWR